MNKLFKSTDFTATQWDDAEQKAKFANHFVRFVQADFPQSLFPKWFYTRLSMTFGHIAHYNQLGFWETYFTTLDDKIAFLEYTMQGGGYGDSTYTYSDVEKAIQSWLFTNEQEPWNLHALRQRLTKHTEINEREQLKYLQEKYS